MKNRITTKLKRFRALSGPEQRMFLAALAWLPLFLLGLRVFGMRRFQAWLPRDGSLIEKDLSRDDVARISTLVNIAALHTPFPVTCLTRSLLLGWILRRRGVASQLRIGVRLTKGVLDAHAWLEQAGQPINDRPDVGEQFVPFNQALPCGAFQSP